MGVDRRHFDLRAQRSLRHCNRNSYINIVTRPRKHRMRSRLDDQVQIPRWAAVCPGVAFARQPNPLSIPRPWLDPKLQWLTLDHHAFAIAGGAHVLHLARPAAPRTLNVELHPPTHLRHLSGPMALRALHTSSRSRFTLACRTYLLPLNLEPCHPNPTRHPEIHPHLVLKIGPRLRPMCRLLPTIEHPAEDILEASAKTPARLLFRS